MNRKIPEVLVCAPMDPRSKERLACLGTPRYAGWGGPEGMHAAPLEPEQLVALGREASIIILGPEAIAAEMLQQLPNLCILAVSRAGIEGVDVAAATDRGIPVLNTPGRNAEAVADFTFALIFAMVRKTTQAEDLLRSGGWVNWLSPYKAGLEGLELSGRILGLIGFGHIGRLVAKRADAFGIRILVYDPFVQDRDLESLSINCTSLDRLLADADIVSIHCALTPETREMLNRERLSKMKASAYLINTARAAVINEEALLAALKNKAIAGAALDVFWKEPLPTDHPLMALDNVILTPHVAGMGDGVIARGAKMLVDGIEALLRGESVPNLVNPETLARPL